MQTNELAVAHYRELVSLTVGTRALTYPDWMMLGCAARDLGIPFDVACHLVLEFRGGLSAGSVRPAPMQLTGGGSKPQGYLRSGPPVGQGGGAQYDSGGAPARQIAAWIPEEQQVPAGEVLAQAPLEPLEVEPEKPVAQAPRARERAAPSPPAPTERMIAIEGGVYVPESYVTVARNIRAKFGEFLGARLPVILEAAARNASLNIEIYEPGSAPKPPLATLQQPMAQPPASPSLAQLWESMSTAETERELRFIGRRTLVVRCEAWQSIGFLSRLGWISIDDDKLVRDGQIRQGRGYDWFTVRTDWLVQRSEPMGWLQMAPVICLQDGGSFGVRLLRLRDDSDGPPTIQFLRQVISGMHAESASFAQQRKGLRALTARISGQDASAALLPADGSIPEIQRAAGAALVALRGALAIADTASC